MTDEELKRLEALCEALHEKDVAWFASEAADSFMIRGLDPTTGQLFTVAEGLYDTDSRFLAAAKLAVPAALAEIRRLRKNLATMMADHDECILACGDDRVSGQPIAAVIRELRVQRDFAHK